MLNGKKHTTVWIGLLIGILTVLMMGGQIFVGVQQHYMSATVNNPDSGVLHQHQMNHKRIVELELELESLKTEVDK